MDPAAGLIAVQEGYEAGFERGYTEGFDSGREKAAAEEAAVMARLERAHHALSLAARALHERQALELAGLERDITAAAFELAEAVVGRELALAASPGLEAVARALRLAPPGEAAVVRLHPADAAEVNRAVEPGGAVDPSRNLTVVADERVEPGGCVVEAGDCRVDAQISPALARVRDALLGAPELTGAGR
ncbi:MAG TPA: FliH/SctL family protein [Acidimicrobiia bacterium]|nr:FliH/SctL family protein [Acidimicrobiia bacterium]